MLIPNKRYFELYGVPNDSSKSMKPKSIKSFGNHFLLNRVAEKLELKDILSVHFPSTWKDMLTYPFYMVCKGNVMMYAEDFCDMSVNFAEKDILQDSLLG